jgi:hypothetical protein
MNYRVNYYQKNKENIKAYNAKYHLENKEERLEKMRNYWLNNKDTLKELKNEVFECICGSHYTRCNKIKHLKTKKHMNYRNNSIDKIIDRLQKRMTILEQSE